MLLDDIKENYQEIELANGEKKAGVFPTHDWYLEFAQHVDFNGATVLDVGCSEGMYGVYSTKDGAKTITAVETESKKTAVAAQLFADHKVKGEIIEKNASDFVSKKEYDVVLLPMIIHWLKSPKKDIARLAGYAKKSIVFIYREQNENYLPNHGSFFPTKNELLEIIPFPVKVMVDKTLAVQDQGKKIKLLVLERQVGVKEDEKIIERTGKQYTPTWKKKFSALHGEAPFENFAGFIKGGYKERYMEGAKDLMGDDPMKHTHGKKAPKISAKDRRAVKSKLLLLVKASIKSGYTLGDMTRRNIMIEDGKVHFIDFEVVDKLRDGRLANKKRVQLWDDTLKAIGVDYGFDGDMERLAKELQ